MCQVKCLTSTVSLTKYLQYSAFLSGYALHSRQVQPDRSRKGVFEATYLLPLLFTPQTTLCQLSVLHST